MRILARSALASEKTISSHEVCCLPNGLLRSLTPFFATNEENTLILFFFRTTPREIASFWTFWKPTPKSLDKWFMKNRIVCRTFLRKTQGKLLWENEFFIRQIALLCNIPWVWCILLGPAYLKNPWNNSICLIFEMLKSLHEDWNCTARRSTLLTTNI